jgi:hypothetical protein
MKHGIEKPIENWTKFPNCILDHLDQFTPMEFKVLGLMVRKNLGFDNPNKAFSIQYLCDKLNISQRKTVRKAVRGLLDKGSIVETGKGKRGVRMFEINWIAPTGVKNTPVDWGKKYPRSGVKNTPDLGQKSTPIKRTTTVKETTTTRQADPPPQAPVDAAPSSSPPFSLQEIQGLIPESLAKPSTLKMLQKHVGKGENYVRQAVMYANDFSKKTSWQSYKAFLGKCLEQGWAEGYEPEACPPDSPKAACHREWTPPPPVPESERLTPAQIRAIREKAKKAKKKGKKGRAA